MTNSNDDELVKRLRSGRHNNNLIETLGGCQHYVSCLKAADKIEVDAKRIEELEAANKAWAGTYKQQSKTIGEIDRENFDLQTRVAELEAAEKDSIETIAVMTVKATELAGQNERYRKALERLGGRQSFNHSDLSWDHRINSAYNELKARIDFANESREVNDE